MLRLFLLFFIYPLIGHTYPEFIRHGYNNCMACHHSPHGGGLLTDYGKGIAQAFSLQGGEYSKSKLKQFLTADGVLEEAIQARIANIKSDTEDKVFPMQADLLLGAHVGKTFSNISIAKLPERGRESEEEQNAYLIREAGLKYQYDKKSLFHFMMGRTPLGLNIPDHSTYIKRRNKNDTQDLTSQVAYLYFSEKYKLNLRLLLPSGQEKEGNSESGLLFKYHYLWNPHIETGVQLLTADGEVIDRQLYGVFGKVGLFKKLVLLFEVDKTLRSVEGETENPEQLTSYAKLSFFPWEWVELFYAYEGLKLDYQTTSEQTGLHYGSKVSLTRNISLQIDYKNYEVGDIKTNLIMTQLYLNWW